MIVVVADRRACNGAENGARKLRGFAVAAVGDRHAGRVDGDDFNRVDFLNAIHLIGRIGVGTIVSAVARASAEKKNGREGCRCGNLCVLFHSFQSFGIIRLREA